MFDSTLAAELADRVGSRVEITLDDETVIEGILSTVVGDLLTVIEVSTYGPGVAVNISISAVSIISFPQAA
ncbi:hypothetical protein GMB86_02635 [Terrilactibacillus sp. BCM23-1]|uniref:DUF2642 domain-containing protein n=1 Tax=Terrilactibacillus tamarindi TaxID=2599694 RepID=A0A6N8CMY7_9BACI|nr:hypothetical protein [Terrilactibacillus tamarindi]MTT30910.1 hypothetical protein [Terrilactibacillus tamarindi]